DAVLPEGYEVSESALQRVFDEDDREKVIGNVTQNVTDLADAYPDVEFYYFFTPYSAAWWKVTLEQGVFDRQIDAEKTAIEEILKHPNIKLFSFNCLTDITTDLNNYKDISHYGAWVNTLMLRMMHDDKCLLTYENYEEYLQSERGFYGSFDYRSLKTQEDYEDDTEASRIITEKYMND
nr:hypothetical protein [Lachnospiraceae bacterium]